MSFFCQKDDLLTLCILYCIEEGVLHTTPISIKSLINYKVNYHTVNP